MGEFRGNMEGAAAEAEACVPCEGPKGPTFVLKKWQAVAMWSWAISVDTCAICRNPLSEPSLEWQAGTETEQGVQIAWGGCGHVFHLDCIGRWLKTRNFCPLCNQEWEFAKVEKIGGYDAGDKS